MALTYRQMKAAFNELTEEQLDMQASIIIIDPATPDECELHNIDGNLLANDKEFRNIDLDELDVDENLPLMLVVR